MWTQPKINWDIEDKINVSDYNRIKNNMQYLINLAYELYPEFGIVALGQDKTYSDLPYASIWNAIERDIDAIYANTFQYPEHKDTNTYYPNNKYISSADLNRIETFQVKMKELLENQKRGRHRLSFRLGGDRYA
ncbi:hypothetical protein [Holdemania sp. 1001302B_160321_E10]|uniref:hypothetical protein n=1 Tax=Holdemania sp. 1001302B_160321_E10 TaxID=2787120 RepID=UPI00189C57DE|nr:hypothetical protein [Holdemania sp. 1001302B_160321_E10]